MSPGKTLALHSYKGGTGKTTLISNLAAFFAKSGKRVCLLDFDLYAPTLTIYFRKTPRLCLNNLLSGEAEISDVLVDLSPELGLDGKLFLGFSSPGKEDVRDIEIKHEIKWQLAALRRFISAKNQLFEEYKIDYLFLDTSPGIRYWSINTLATADILLLIMKDNDVDIEGTKTMITDIYDSLTKFGSKYFIVLNKVSGASPTNEYNLRADEKAFEADLGRSFGTKVISSIPCFCDIQFSRHEFLFAVEQPDHPFSKKLVTLAERIEGLALI
jgi:MinD-like ATPase involved in chromosome partitioning or flagellar assembly